MRAIPGYDDDKVELRKAVRSYLRDTCGLETVRAWDESSEFPWHIYRAMGDMGWLGIPFSEEDGGSGGDAIDESIVLEELGYVMGPLASTSLISVMTCGKAIRDLGTAEQRARWIPGLSSGQMLFSFALTEPHAGSDAGALTTRAVRVDDTWRISGGKIFCTGATIATHLVVMARTDSRPSSERGDVGMFVVETNAPGLEITTIPKLGLHPTPSCTLFFDDVVIPADHVLGEPGGAWAHVTASLNRERLAISAMCTGMAQAALDFAHRYALERRQFGVAIAEFEAVREHLANMLIAAEGSRAHMQLAAELEVKGRSIAHVAAAAKVVSSEAAVANAREGMQVLGGYGYTNEFPMQRFLRDALIHPIAGGSNEIQRNLIGVELLKRSGADEEASLETWLDPILKTEDPAVLDAAVRRAVAELAPESAASAFAADAMALPVGLGLPVASRHGATATRTGDGWSFRGALASLSVGGSAKSCLYLAEEEGAPLVVRSERDGQAVGGEVVLDRSETAEVLDRLTRAVAAALLAANKAMLRDIAGRIRVRHEARAGRWDGQALLHRLADLNTQCEASELQLARSVDDSSAGGTRSLLLSLLASLSVGRVAVELGHVLAVEDGDGGVAAFDRWAERFMAYRDTVGSESALKLALAEVGLALGRASSAVKA